MAVNAKRTERVPVYFTEQEYTDMLRSAARFDKKPGEYIRFETLRSMYGSLGMARNVRNDNDSASEGQDE